MAPVLQIDAVRRVRTRSGALRRRSTTPRTSIWRAAGWCRRTTRRLGLDFLRSCSIKNQMASVIFSLEMSKSEIVMRLLSAEAKIKLADMRSGRMSDDDWTRLARRMSEISEAPLYIDDSPNLTMMEIRAKARRLKQKAGLRLVVIDYLQLMTSGKKVESRQQEVSEFSRSLKLLAKELEVPVVAISQLNRGPEQRTDKKPMISDLRESGCLTANTRILRADTGAEVTFGELMRTGERPLVWSLDERKRMVARPMTNVFPSGRKEVFKVRLASGREVEATAQPSVHDVRRLDAVGRAEGWRPRGGAAAGTGARAYASGWTTRDHPAGAHDRRRIVREAPADPLREHRRGEPGRGDDGGGSTSASPPIRDDYAAARVTTLRLPAPYRLTHGKRNPIAAWLDGLGLFGKRSYEKFVPQEVFALPERPGGAVPAPPVGDRRLGALGCEGTSRRASTTRRPAADWSTTSRSCCCALGVLGRISASARRATATAGTCISTARRTRSQFLTHVGVTGRRRGSTVRFLPSWRCKSAGPARYGAE